MCRRLSMLRCIFFPTSTWNCNIYLTCTSIKGCQFPARTLLHILGQTDAVIQKNKTVIINLWMAKPLNLMKEFQLTPCGQCLKAKIKQHTEAKGHLLIKIKQRRPRLEKKKRDKLLHFWSEMYRHKCYRSTRKELAEDAITYPLRTGGRTKLHSEHRNHSHCTPKRYSTT